MSKDKAVLEIPSMTRWTKEEEKRYQISSAIVRRAWQSISYTEGVLLTDIEAILGDDSRCGAFKSVVKRELRRMGGYIQDSIYNEYKIQILSANNIDEPIEDAETEGALKV